MDRTPARLMLRAVEVLGTPDLFIRPDDDEQRLLQSWQGHVHAHFPYGRRIGTWARKLRAEYEAGRLSEAVVLVPARTDTAWWRDATKHCTAVCFVRGRLRFPGERSSAPFPSALVYIGQRIDVFVDAFDELGDVRRPMQLR